MGDFLGRDYRHKATDNHEEIDEFLQEWKADEAEEAGTHPCSDEASDEAESPKGEGGVGKEPYLQAEKCVEDVEGEEEGL